MKGLCREKDRAMKKLNKKVQKQILNNKIVKIQKLAFQFERKKYHDQLCFYTVKTHNLANLVKKSKRLFKLTPDEEVNKKKNKKKDKVFKTSVKYNLKHSRPRR